MEPHGLTSKKNLQRSRRHPNDHQLHTAPNGQLQQKHLHQRTRRVPKRHPHRRQRLQPRHPKSARAARIPRGHRGQVGAGWIWHNAALSVAGKIIDSVKVGHIKRFILVGGCDGAKPGRSYYTELVEKAPKNTIILTLACGKFRFFDKELGTIDDIPRLLDIGQCNDAYSAVKIAQALADAFGVGVNDLPLSMVLSWYEQKAVAILLSLLYLGIKDIRLGPSLPAFVSPGILKVLVEKFNIMPIKTADEDLKEIMK